MKRCLIIVDYQNDFVTGSLGFDGARRIEKSIENKIKLYRERGDDIIFTLDTHGEDYPGTLEGRRLPVLHCIKGTPGHDLYGGVKLLKKATDKVFCKGTFGSGRLYDYLKHTPYETIELAGVVSNICMLANAVLAKTAQPETEIIVDAKCTAAADESLYNSALAVMEALQITIINRDGEGYE